MVLMVEGGHAYMQMKLRKIPRVDSSRADPSRTKQWKMMLNYLCAAVQVQCCFYMSSAGGHKLRLDIMISYSLYSHQVHI